MNPTKIITIGVIGAGSCTPDEYQQAEELGRLIALKGARLVCGGLGGVMEATCKGAKSENGVTIGIISTDDKSTANEYVDIVIPTGIGQARNLIIINTADLIIAMPGKYGTLSEMAFALKSNKPLVSLSQWQVDDKIIRADSPEDAIDKASKILER